MSRTSSRAKILLPTPEEDKAIVAAAKGDPDAKPLSAKQLAAIVPMRLVRGRPKSANKKLLVSIRYSPEVVACFKSTGAGWQARMDTVLRQCVARRTRAA